MRYEYPSFRIDKRDWLKGNNAYDDYPEGGMIASSIGANSFSKPGLLSQSPSLGSSVTSSLPTTGVISWGIGSGASAPSVMAVYSNANQDALFYTVNPATGAMTKVGTDDTTRNYILGVTDSVFYDSNFYTTSDTDICKNSADLATRDQNWWTGTMSQSALTSGVPHPLLVYESIMYIADGRYLHKLDGTTVSLQVWDAPPDHVITAMVEFNGLIYIVAEPYKNLAGTVHGLSQMFSWDGLMESWYEQYFLDYRVNSLHVYKNQLFAWTNDYLGLWTGSILEPLRPVTSQVFKCHITATSDSMFYADGTDLIRYGKPFIPGLNHKFYEYLSAFGDDAFAGILSATGDSMIITEEDDTASPNYFISDINTPSTTATRTVTFNERFFVKPVKVRGIVIETEALASGQKVKVGYVDSAGQTQYPTKDSGEFDNATSKMAGKRTWRFDVHGKDATRSLKPTIQITAGVHVRSIDYLYTASEDKTNA